MDRLWSSLIIFVFLVLPTNAQYDYMLTHAPDANLMGVDIGDSFSFRTNSGSDDFIIGEDIELGVTHSIPPGHEFNITIKEEPKLSSLHASFSQYSILTKLEFNGSIYDKYLSMNPISKTIPHNLILFVDWEYYEGLLQGEYEEVNDYTSNHAFVLGMTDSEFVLIETYDHNAKPVGIGQTINTLTFELRYDLETGVINYLTMMWSMSTDYDINPIFGSTGLQRSNYVYKSLSSDDIKPINKTTNISDADFYFTNFKVIFISLIVIKFSKRK